MKRDELQTLVGRLKDTALGVSDSTLELERQEAADFYHGRNWKPAPEGRSQVIDRVLMDTVEWAHAQVMKVFASADEIVRFEPVGQEDEALAEQETAYVNHFLLNKKDGFLTLYDATKDALLFRNGHIKCYWEVRKKTTVESYTNLTEDRLAKLMSDYAEEGAEVEEIEREDTQVLTEMGAVPAVNVKLRVTTMKGELCSDAVPPEEIIVSEDAKGRLQDLPFVGHLTTRRRSDLLEMGLPRKFVDDLPAYGEMEDEDSTAGRRDVVLEDDPEVALDRSMDEIEYLEAYVRVDYNDDGKAELRKVVLVGGRIPPGEEWIEEVDCIPIVYGVPVRVPHRHIGISYYDLLKDLQEIRSTLYRQLLDNVYLTNNQRPVINENINMRDLAVYKPGAPIRAAGTNPVGQDIMWAAPQPIVQQLIPVLDQMDLLKESRTGIGRNNTNIDPDVLTNAPDALVARAMTAANAKVEMIIRLLAETLIKDWVRLAHSMLIKYADQPAVFKLRGQYIPVDPREWKERDDLTVSVGLGTGTEEEKQQRLMMLGGVMDKAAQAGIVLPNNIYNFAEDTTKALGFKMPGRYFTDPSTPEFQQMQQQQSQAQQQQAMQAMQQQAQAMAMVEQVKGQYKSQGDQIKAQTELKKQQNEIAFKLRELLQNGELELAKLEVDAFIEGANVDLGQPGMGAELADGIG